MPVMKKYYIFLSILSVILIGFTVLTILYFHDYYEITKEIYKLELDYTFTSLIPFITPEETTPKERPDTSLLQAEADYSLRLGIVFLVIACIILILLAITIIKMFRIKHQQLDKETTNL